MNTFESTIKEMGTGGKGSDLFCAKKAALNKLLTKQHLKEMLKDVLVEVKTSEEDKKKLKARLAELRRNLTETESTYKDILEETEAGLELMKQNFEAYKTAYEKVRDYKPKYRVLQTYRDIFRASMSLNGNLMKIYVLQPVKRIGGLYFTLGVVVLLLLASRLRSSKSDPDTE
jgi:DNA repair exonuclease SbcCD ATPase subunit